MATKYKAETTNGKEVVGELIYEGLTPYIQQDFEFGMMMVKVVPDSIQEVEDD